MPDVDHQQIVIIKRHAVHDEGHHGGAWKIAFADFMTAMMALFLVLWLISSTSDKTKRTVAQYFNPVKLVDMTTQKKGFRDPKESEMASGRMVEPQEREARPDEPTAILEVRRPIPAKPISSKASPIADPFAPSGEIAEGEDELPGKLEARQRNYVPDKPDEPFDDPFSTVPLRADKNAHVDQQSQKASQPDAARVDAPKEDAAPELARREAQTEMRVSGQRASEARQAGEADLDKLRSDIIAAGKGGSSEKAGPRIEVQSTDEGLLVSLTDDENYAMFAVGSAEPTKGTVAVMARIAKLLQARAGTLVIRGHTDGRPYRSASYDNWRLSTARAQTAHDILVRGGFEESRVERIEGHADRLLKDGSDPNAPENRRIEILLREKKP